MQGQVQEQRVSVLGVGIHPLSEADALSRVTAWHDAEEGRYIATVNAEIVMRAQVDAQLAAALRQADLVLPDGAGVVWAGQVLGTPFPERVAGIDFMTALITRAATRQERVYFLGGKPGVARTAAEKLQQSVPGLVVAGVRDGYFQDCETESIVAAIRESGARYLFVGLGAPKQECWAHAQRTSLPGVTAVCVGGSFDVLAGHLRRAPLWMQRHRLEWLYRAYKQPSRWKRMAVLPRFIYAVRREAKRRNNRRGG